MNVHIGTIIFSNVQIGTFVMCIIIILKLVYKYVKYNIFLLIMNLNEFIIYYLYLEIIFAIVDDSIGIPS